MPYKWRPRTPRTAGAVQQEHPARKVLVVDDCADTADSLAGLLETWGHDARAAHNGAEALRLARDQRPEVVILDVGLPGMDGYEVARLLRAGAGGEEIRILMLSGYGSAEDRRRSEQAGCDGHLTKPVDLAALQAFLSGETLEVEVLETPA